MVVICAVVLHMLHLPAQQVIVVCGGDAGGRVGHGGKIAVVVVGVGYCITVSEGFCFDTPFVIIGVFFCTVITIGQLLQILVFIFRVFVGSQ